MVGESEEIKAGDWVEVTASNEKLRERSGAVSAGVIPGDVYRVGIVHHRPQGNCVNVSVGHSAISVWLYESDVRLTPGFVARFDGQTAVQRAALDGRWFHLGDRVRPAKGLPGASGEGTVVALFVDRPQAVVVWDDGRRDHLGFLHITREDIEEASFQSAQASMFKSSYDRVIAMNLEANRVEARRRAELERIRKAEAGLFVPVRGQPGVFHEHDESGFRTGRLVRVEPPAASPPPVAVPAARHYPGTCTRCGGDAYVGLLSIECAAGPACAPPREPEPAIVEVVTINYTSGHRGLPRSRDVYTGDLACAWPGMAERAWRARDEGESPGPSACIHPTREGAVALWRERRASRERAAAYAGSPERAEHRHGEPSLSRSTIFEAIHGALRISPSGIR